VFSCSVQFVFLMWFVLQHGICICNDHKKHQKKLSTQNEIEEGIWQIPPFHRRTTLYYTI